LKNNEVASYLTNRFVKEKAQREQLVTIVFHFDAMGNVFRRKVHAIVLERSPLDRLILVFFLLQPPCVAFVVFFLLLFDLLDLGFAVLLFLATLLGCRRSLLGFARGGYRFGLDLDLGCCG